MDPRLQPTPPAVVPSTASRSLAPAIAVFALTLTLSAVFPVGNVGVGLASASTEAKNPTDAERMVQSVADELIGIVRDPALDPASKRIKIEESLYDRADFATIAKLVLARNYARFTEAQREQFQKEFRAYLSSTYGKNIDTYTEGDASIDDVVMELLGSRDEARGDVTVYSKIQQAGQPEVLVNYRLRRVDGDWKIIDVIAEGISMISNLRSQFQEIISSSGPEGLLKKLREKNSDNS